MKATKITKKKKRVGLYPVAFIVMFWSCLVFHSAFAYDYPQGIPHAWVEPDIERPSAPDNWDSELPGYYYIDNSGSCSDASDYGWPAMPRCSLPYNLQAGDRVEIHGGPYTGSQWIITGAGDESAPVWIIGMGDKPVIRRETILKGGYLYIDGLRWDSDTAMLQLRPHNYSTLNHVLIRNCEMSGSGTDQGFSSAIAIYGNSSEERNSHFIIYNNYIHDLGDSSPNAAENDYHGIAPSKNVDFVWILDNHIHNMGGDSVQIGVASTADENRVKYIYVARNHFHDDGENAVDVKESDNIAIISNIMHGYDSGINSGSGNAMIIHDGAANIWAVNNIIYDSDKGIGITSGSDAKIIGNLIYGVNSAIFTWQCENIIVINNTLDGYETGIDVTNAAANIEGNILTNRTSATAYDIILDTTGVVANAIVDYNLFFTDSSSRSYFAGQVYDVAAMKNEGYCLHCPVESDPLYKGEGDYGLADGSPAESVNIMHNVYSEYFDLFGTSIKYDILGTARPQGSGWDIGAYEYTENGGGTTTTTRADVDNNSTINTTDAMLTLRHSLGLSMNGTNWNSNSTTGDVNCDGTSNSTDAMLILRYSVGLSMSGTSWCVE